MARIANSQSDSPHMRYAPTSARVMGELSTRKPADSKREPRNVPTLPVVTARQLAKHPRAAEYAKPHTHKGAARCVACKPVAARVRPTPRHWSDPSPEAGDVATARTEASGVALSPIRDLAGRRTPQHVQYRQQRTVKTKWLPAKTEPDPCPDGNWPPPPPPPRGKRREVRWNAPMVTTDALY